MTRNDLVSDVDSAAHFDETDASEAISRTTPQKMESVDTAGQHLSGWLDDGRNLRDRERKGWKKWRSKQFQTE